MLPKFELLVLRLGRLGSIGSNTVVPGSNEPPAGPPENVSTRWLNALIASRRNSIRSRSVIVTSLCKFRSNDANPGPRPFPTEQFPNSLDGWVTFVVSNHRIDPGFTPSPATYLSTVCSELLQFGRALRK